MTIGFWTVPFAVKTVPEAYCTAGGATSARPVGSEMMKETVCDAGVGASQFAVAAEV